MAASIFERWIATLADVASDIGARFAFKAAIEAIEHDGGFVLREPGGREIGTVAADGAIAGGRAPRMRGTEVKVELGDRHCIVDRVVYPAGARSYLDAVIGNQIDRLAPFDHGDAVYAWRLDGDTPAAEVTDKAIGVLVSIASRRRVVEAVRPLVMAGLVPVEIAVGDDNVAPAVIVPLDGNEPADAERIRRAVKAVATIIAILGILGNAGNWWLEHRLRGELAAVDASLTSKRKAVEQASLSPTTAAARQKWIAEIAADRGRRNTLPILTRLSTVLPDTVYLTELHVEGAAVRISGVATDAAALVPLLESDPQIENVHFVAPLSRRERDNRIGFDLALTWLPQP